MTFLEAAIEILRQAQGPLKVAEITERSVNQQLLSHVGRDPETTMRNSLSGALRSNAHGGILERVRPGTYQLRAGAAIPAGVSAAAQEQRARVEAAAEPAAERAPKAKSRAKKKTSRGRSSAKTVEAAPLPSAPTASDEPEPTPMSAPETSPDTPTTPAQSSESSSESAQELVFEAPSGSGLDGVTDVAIVMANAMSRLADERPELREELEAMQQRKGDEEEAAEEPLRSRAARGSGRDSERRSSRSEASNGAAEERSGRKRRRRRRRGKKSEWASEPVITQRITARAGDSLLDKAAALLANAGSKALHVRQISEGLAQQKVLNGEISEIERAVTAAMIADSHRFGSASRFVLRGDARYQLRGARLPEAAATAESTVRKALRVLEKETSEQLVRWLEGVGARALDALMRIYLEKESIQVISTLASGRGITRLIAQEFDPEEGPMNWLVVGVPKKATFDSRALDTELERNNCAAAMIFCMGDASAFGALADIRVVSVRQLAEWLLQSGVAVETLEFRVPVLNPWVLESIGGLDT